MYSDMARTNVSYYNDDSKRNKGMYRQRIQKAWGHTAHRGWARLLLDRARYLIIHGPAHRSAISAATPADEDDQYLGSELQREIPDFVVFPENFGNLGFRCS